ncbi:hypothetical protein AMES_5484 [Amycolatopsis mediterranei S699]|uniref:YbaB/EbfC DNA-binding family protein n=2 Tax=Amycolatopsis mediterranei TaxID=33910 RepID=A0A0H3DCF8_AMYMU|nr:YbaB/EbfC family nucleoid-associated protein [Amycolatopsis mediterranei]ADJ47309.1 conserved hypothetical protein [Amycolatopsis mediterranei U32]AEK44137.1 hypothetical protein RAM_28300 [Amycolatopsis mediterranei S699]AFO79020.1 hypothetical protein AMES_5484 [Amycolatopsis mediterranei S699]AGT86148.1 hypothetical protein B737_5484 [Amycolatopsis mediterranei RB]KDO12504.1 hypothetical protein DV26_02340 [Amycolatopsis mediterranei]
MGGPVPGSGADAIVGIDRLVAKAKAQRYRAMQAAVARVSVTETAGDGLVTATVDAAGNLTGLRLTDRVRELSGAQVAAAVLRTVRPARSRLPDRFGEVMAETIGDDERTRETIAGNYRAKFPEPEPEPGTSQAQQESVRRPPAGGPDDDDLGGSFMVRD